MYSSPVGTDVLEALHFVRCTFKGIPLPSISNCRFDNCSFENVDFGLGAHQGVKTRAHDRMLAGRRGNDRIARASFQDCDFNQTRFVGMSVEEVSISGGTISSMTFDRCRFDKELILLRCIGQSRIRMNEECSFGGRYVESLEGQNWPTDRLPRWTTIGFIKRLPIPKVGFATLGVVALVVPLPRTRRRLKLSRQQARLGFVSPWQ